MSSPATQPLPTLPLERPARHWAAPLTANLWVLAALVAILLASPFVEAGKPLLFVAVDKYWRQIAIFTGINITLALSLQLINGIAGQFSLGHAGFMAVGAYIGGYAVSTYGGRANADGDTVEWANPGGVLLYMLALLGVTLVTVALIYALYRLVLLGRRLHRTVPLFVMCAAIVWLVADMVVIRKVGNADTHVLGALTSFAAFLSAVTSSHEWLITHGAGAATWLTDLTPAGLRRPACLVVSLLGGGAMAAIVGFVVGLPTLRLRGDYLAIATLGVSELIRTAITNSAPFGRATGMSAPTYPVDADPSENIAQVYYFPWVYGVALLAFVVVWRIQHSPKGRALQCLREDEIAAGAVGINVTSHKVLAFVVGAFLAGMAGALFAHYTYINPKQFDLTKSIELVVMVTLGGLGSVPGTIVAAVLLSLFQPLLQSSGSMFPAWVPATPEAYAAASTRPSAPAALGPMYALRRLTQFLADYRLVVYALLLILAMLARSRGWFSFSKKRV